MKFLQINPSVFEILASLILSYSFTKIIYRLFLHPLASFPGPVLASLTNWHKFYYNWYRNGVHSSKIKQWHEQYGPIIRIAPNELHFSDPHAYKAIYAHHGLRKDAAFYKFMTEDSLVGQLGINDNKRKRKIFAGLLSINTIRSHGNTDGILWTKANQLSSTLKRLCQSGQMQTIVNITDVSKCFTYDVIKGLALGPSNALSTSSPKFKPPFVVSNASVPHTLWFVQQFPFIVRIVRGLPDIVLFLLSPSLLVLKRERVNSSTEAINRSRAFDRRQLPKLANICSQVIHTRQKDTKMQISDYYLGQELFDFLVAGTELPANAISFSIFHIARNPAIIERLRQELLQATLQVGNQLPSLAELEKLPFLSAVVKETLRLGNLVPGRLPRVTPPEGMSLTGLYIPGCTVVSASAHLIHMNPSIFPEPEKFVPERWLVGERGSFIAEIDPDKYLFAFSIGGRDCIGRNLAIAEIRLFIASLVSCFDFELACPQDYVQDLTWRDNIVASYDRDIRIAIRER